VRSRSSVARLAFIFAVASLLFLFGGASHAQKKNPPAKPVNLNSASAEELQQVPGIGPATAKSIINFREKSGPFRRVEDLLAIRGISKQALERIRPYVTVSAPEASPPRK
jgi:competence protein ComEA